jgi:transitional endoplasmic reticulum ATPase
MTTTIQLNVAKAYPNDVGRTIARLNPDAMEHLGLQPGDLIAIKGTDMTVAKVWRADRQDWNTETVRLDEFARHNANVDIGGHVEIHSVKTTIAASITLTLAPPEEVPMTTSVTLVSPEEVSVPYGSDIADMVKYYFHKRVVMEGDILPVRMNSNDAVPHSTDQAIVLQVVATDPTGGVRATDETSVIIQEIIE